MGPFPRRLQADALTSAGVYFWAGAEETGMKDWRERVADIFTKHGKIAENEVRPGVGTSDFPAHHPSTLIPIFYKCE